MQDENSLPGFKVKWLLISVRVVLRKESELTKACLIGSMDSMNGSGIAGGQMETEMDDLVGNKWTCKLVIRILS